LFSISTAFILDGTSIILKDFSAAAFAFVTSDKSRILKLIFKNFSIINFDS
jgi:hypothetical protein